jgi:hypothetical protein
MGIYIKGMEMPKICGQCQIKLGIDCELWRHVRSVSLDRHKDCPLIEIPPHGRLIDADALADVFRGFIAMYDSCPFSQLSLPDKARRDELQSALAEVINAPTIIPADSKDIPDAIKERWAGIYFDALQTIIPASGGQEDE